MKLKIINPNKLRKKGAERDWESVVRRELKEDSKWRFKKKKKKNSPQLTEQELED